MYNFRRDYYSGLKGLYFNSILRSIIRLGNLDKRDVKILDFGCGHSKLKKILGNKVIGYDIIPDLSDVPDWRKIKFDVVVANEVFYIMTEEEINKFIDTVYKINNKCQIITGTSRQGFINKIAMLSSGERNAYADTKTSSKDEFRILIKNLKLIKSTSVWGMCDIRLFEFL